MPTVNKRRKFIKILLQILYNFYSYYLIYFMYMKTYIQNTYINMVMVIFHS